MLPQPFSLLAVKKQPQKHSSGVRVGQSCPSHNLPLLPWLIALFCSLTLPLSLLFTSPASDQLSSIAMISLFWKKMGSIRDGHFPAVGLLLSQQVGPR